MDFWWLPPEINSARMYAGAGSGPMWAAAAGWDAICAELAETAGNFLSALIGLAGVWRGPSADAMTAAGLHYARWLHATAAQTEQTASSARGAAAVFETARATIVPPALVAANRAQHAVLVATNLFGQNTAAIAALEAAYAEMWAADVAVMAEYQAASAACTAGLPAFSPPKSATVSAGQNAAGTSTGSALTSGPLYDSFQSLLSSGPYEIPIALLSMFNVLWAVASPASPVMQALNRLSAAAEASVIFPPRPAAPTPKLPDVHASTGTATRLGRLRAPSWTQPATKPAPAAPAVRPLPASQTEILPLPLPAPIPVTRGGTPTKQQRPEPEYGTPVRFVTRPPAGG